VACLTAPIAPIWWEKFLKIVALPSTVFSCLSIEHMKIHAAMLGITLTSFASMTWFYITQEDMWEPNRMRQKVLKMLLVVPGCILISGYLLYGLYSMFSAYSLVKRIELNKKL